MTEVIIKAESPCPLALSCLVLEIGLCGTSVGTIQKLMEALQNQGRNRSMNSFFLFVLARSSVVLATVWQLLPFRYKDHH